MSGSNKAAKEFLARQKGYSDATTSLDPTISDEMDIEYMRGYREGLVHMLEWAKLGVEGFDRDFPHIRLIKE